MAPGATQSQDPAQTQGDGQTTPENDGFFSGNVVEVAANHVTVTRTILNKRPERRTFRIDGNTKVEGKMKPQSRVTVRYAPGDDGDVALSILVRPERSPNGKKK